MKIIRKITVLLLLLYVLATAWIFFTAKGFEMYVIAYTGTISVALLILFVFATFSLESENMLLKIITYIITAIVLLLMFIPGLMIAAV